MTERASNTENEEQVTPSEYKDWPTVIKYCKEALLLIPEAKEGLAAMGRCEERLLLLLADAAEAQGDMGLARRYDEKAK